MEITIRLLMIFVFTMILNGCFVPPGMRLNPTPDARIPPNIKAHFIPITVQLVAELNARKNTPYNTYYIGPYDVLNIYVWNHPEFNGPLGQAPAESGINANLLNTSLTPTGFLVDTYGKVFFPLVGYISVEGKTVNSVRVEVTRALKRYIRNPQVDIRVSAFRSKKVYVMGEVSKPGLFPLNDVPMSITDAINLAGGLINDAADPSHIFVIRGNYACPEVYWLNASQASSLLLGENFFLQPRDVVFISTANIALWNRAITQILPTIQTLWFSYSLIKRN